MPVKNPARRTRAVTRRTGRKGSREDDASHRISGGFSSKAFLAVTALGFVGFVAMLGHLYGVVSSEQGLDLGAVRLRLRSQMQSKQQIPVTNAVVASAISSATSLSPLTQFPMATHDRRSDSIPIAPTVIQNNYPKQSPSLGGPKSSAPLDSNKPLAARARTLLSDGRSSDPTLDENNEPTPLPHCKWRVHPGLYLGDFASPGTSEQAEVLAKEDCIKQGPQACAGVTCASSRLVCSARRGVPYLQPSPDNEVSFTLECEHGNLDKQPPLEPELPTVSPDFNVAELDTSVFQVGPPGLREPLQAGRAALVVIAHNRPDCLSTCLRTIVDQDGVDVFKLVVSLDDPSSFAKMEDSLLQFKGKRQIEVWKKPIETLKTAVQKIAAHFRFALSQAFDQNNYQFAIFLENDLTLAPDALWYFRSAAWLLEEDPSLFCVSAWNDNGFRTLVSDEKRVFRTDYFPGLGWMIHRNTWSQIKDIWPKNPTTGWDHWLRHGSGLRPRECIIPEVSRTHHFDTKGTNVKAGTGIAKLLEKMVTSNLPAGELRITSSLLKDTYENELHEMFLGAEITSQSGLDFMRPEQRYILPYVREEYKNIAKKLDIYGAQARTAHRGMIITRHPKNRAMVVLIDRRQSNGFLKDGDVWKPNPKRRIGGARRGQSCDQFCQSHRLRCDPRELEYVNRCSVLRKYFPCENGCGHQVGLEIPAYVHDAKLDTALQCLVTDEPMPTCQAGHKSTTRMCACIP